MTCKELINARSMKEPQVIVGEVGTGTWRQADLIRTLAAFSVGHWSIDLSCVMKQLLWESLGLRVTVGDL